MGKPEDWKVILNQLKSCKTDGVDSVRSAVKELRNNDYCHLFEVRDRGVIKERIYYVFEVPTPFTQGLLERVRNENAGADITYRPIKSIKPVEKTENPQLEKSYMEKLHEEKPYVEKPETENPTLLIKECTNNRNTDNRSTNNRITNKRFTNKETTTREGELGKNEKMSSSPLGYNFLKKEIYPQLNHNTIRNIQKNIEGLTEERFHKVYKFAEEYVKSGKGENFNAILYQGLKEEWNFEVEKKESVKNELSPEKKKWLSRYSGITSNKALKEEIEGIIRSIPIEELNKNRSRLSQLDIYGFKCYLGALKSRCRGMRG